MRCASPPASCLLMTIFVQDLLLASIQTSISLLNKVTTHQAEKITSLTTKLDEARVEIEQLKSELSNSQSKMAQLADATSSFQNESKVDMEELKNELKGELSTTKRRVDILEEKQVEMVNATGSLKNDSKVSMEEVARRELLEKWLI